MIICQTPYRVSFAGGGTDLPAFYEQEPGAVLSTTIGYHMYVTVHGRFEPDLRVSYSQTETVARAADLEHDLVRTALQLLDLDEPLEITTIGDVPAGTGMGSSSSLTVGLLNALYAYQGRIVGPARLAGEACHIEIDRLGKPIGRQDQYAAAFGGLNYLRFHPGHRVDVEPVPCPGALLGELERRALLLYTNQRRSADAILQRQSQGTRGRMAELRAMRDLAGEMRRVLVDQRDLDAFAALLHEGWELKRSLGFGISAQGIDAWYSAARAAGAQGGKLLGAGGGGFLLLLAPPECHTAIRAALGHPRELRFSLDRQGSRIIYVNEPHHRAARHAAAPAA